jgi:HAE1 family hydrophobic/amphiphilic exporter-1
MALTLSVGFVVDDAIVMLENIVRAWRWASRRCRRPTTAPRSGLHDPVDDAVARGGFIPVLFLGGIVGRLLHEFAVTIASAILVSGFVSISLTPMLCSRFLKPPHAHGASTTPSRRCSTPGAGSRHHAPRHAALPRRDDGD